MMSQFSHARNDLAKFEGFLKNRESFTFIRFSDGELEILRNRTLVISKGITVFRGRELVNNFPDYDTKSYYPGKHKLIRQDLLRSATYSDHNFYKGIPTWHNNAVHDREFMLRLNSGFDEKMTFSDLFINSNYPYFRLKIVEIFKRYHESVFFIANYRARTIRPFNNEQVLRIPDNFFSNYAEVKNDILGKINELPKGCIVLSSASSLSNVLGLFTKEIRSDITFLDIGTSMNDLLSLQSQTRKYHEIMFAKTLSERLKAVRFKFQRRYRIKW